MAVGVGHQRSWTRALAGVWVIVAAAAAFPRQAWSAKAPTDPKPGAAGTKTTARTAVGQPVTTVPAPRRAGTALSGWGKIGTHEWPAVSGAQVASARTTSLEVWRKPGEDSGRLRFDARRTVYGRISLLVIEPDDASGWLRVALPVRPNQTTGFVRAEDVEIATVTERIVVELSTNTIWLERAGTPILVERVGSGTGGTPTPTGLFFVKEVVPQSNPAGALGPVALGLSGFSEVLSTFGDGSGTIAIHGTNAPGKLGGNVSHGCVRVANSIINRLAAEVPLGTPVLIVKNRSELAEPRDNTPSTPSTAQPDNGTPTNTNSAPTNSAPGTNTPTTNTPVPAGPTTSATPLLRPPVTGVA